MQRPKRGERGINVEMRASPSQVSVIVLNWDGKDFLTGCFEALRGQTFRDFEVILVDNGSTDGSVPWVQQHCPEVRVCALERNLGFAGGNNVGIDRKSVV